MDPYGICYAPPRALTCGATRCAAGDGCCFDPVSRRVSCVGASTCDESALVFACVSSADCGPHLCCHSVVGSYCAASCPGERGSYGEVLCRADSDCKSGKCGHCAAEVMPGQGCCEVGP
ncbi:MAG: hypothetical protein R3B07_18820 [Polyangiaceae bacterium]